MRSPALTVVVATRDRSQQLVRCLRSLTRLAGSPGEVEVIVVDNASGDDTADVVRRAAQHREVTIRYVREDEPGLSAARNAGIAAARGEVVLFVDDDTTVERGVAAAYLDAFADPRVAAAGGPVRPVWPDGRPPTWFPAGVRTYYSLVDHGPQARVVLHPEIVVGANMAFRRDVLADRGFSTRLGRRPHSLLSGEDSERFLRLARDGRRVVWVPDAVVHHHLPPARLTARWLVRRAAGQGRSEVRFVASRREVLAPGARDVTITVGHELRTALLGGWRRALSPRQPGSIRERATGDAVRRARHLGRAAEVVLSRRWSGTRPATTRPTPLRVATTLVVRDELDVVRDHLRYHLDLGVDLVLVTDHRSADGTGEVLAEVERDQPDRVVVVRETGEPFEQDRWVTRMARHAAARGVDWVVHLDADEFLVTDGPTLRATLERVPDDLDVLLLERRNFVLRPPGPEPWFDRMVVREQTSMRHTGDRSPAKVGHRASLSARVAAGNHAVAGGGLRRSATWDHLTVLHYPHRSPDQLVRKVTSGADAVLARARRGKVASHWIEQADVVRRHGADALLATWLLDDEAVAAGLADGTFVTDTRVRDALRALVADA